MLNIKDLSIKNELKKIQYASVYLVNKKETQLNKESYVAGNMSGMVTEVGKQ